MPRFVLLEHDHPTPHFDLLFEVGDVLWAWRLDALPVPGTKIAAVRNFDHRLLYLDYEGPISGGRGRVRRIARGDYVGRVQTEERLEVDLKADQFRGRIVLTHESGERWQLAFD